MKNPPGARRAIVISALLALGLATLVGSGAWGAKLKTRSASISIESPDVRATTATCPRRTNAISGGFEGEQDLDDPMSPAIAPIGSNRNGKRGWEARGFSRSAFPGELTTYAYCRTEKVKSESTVVTLDPSPPGPVADTESLTAKCPRGTNVVSGGFDNPDSFSMGSSGALVFTYQSLRQGKRKWLVSGSNVSNEETTFEAFVYCRDGEKLKTKRRQGTVGSDDELELTAKCGRRQRVVSGGFNLEVPKFGGEGAIAVGSRKQGKRRWVVEVVNTGNAGSATAFAYCEKT
jgi:hypothetical protein